MVTADKEGRCHYIVLGKDPGDMYSTGNWSRHCNVQTGVQELLVNSFTSRQMKAENSTWAKFTSCYDRDGGGGGRRRWQGWWYWHIVEWCSTRFSFSFSFPFLKFISIFITILTALSKLVLLVSSTTYPSQSVKFFKIGIGKGGNLNWFF